MSILTRVVKAIFAAKPKPDVAKASAKAFAEQAVEDALATLGKLPDPDFVLKQAGVKRAELRKLEADDEVAAALETRREAVISTPWSLTPYEGDAAEFVWSQLAGHIDAILRGAWNAIPYGYSVLEAVYEKRDDGRIGILSIGEKPMEWFEPTRDGKLKYSSGSSEAVEVDQVLKFFLTRRNPSYRNPYGEALMSRLYWPWHFRQNGWKWWLRYLERFGDPLLIGQVGDLTQTDEDGKSAADYFVESVQGQGFASVIGVGREDKVTSISHSQAGEFERFEQAIGRRIQKLVLGQTLTSEVGSSGSYAAAKVHNTVRDDKRRADLRLVVPTVQRVVNALWFLNGFGEEPPVVEMQDSAGLEKERADRDAVLVGAGILKPTQQYILDNYDFEEGDFEMVSGDANLINAYSMGLDRLAKLGLKIPTSHPRELFRIPEAAASEEVLTPPVDPAAQTGAALSIQPNGGMATGHGVSLAAPLPGVRQKHRFTDDQAMLEAMMDSAVEEAASPIPANVLRDVIASSESPDDLVAKLEALYRSNDPSEFVELMERALFMADVLGYATAEKRIGE